MKTTISKKRIALFMSAMLMSTMLPGCGDQNKPAPSASSGNDTSSGTSSASSSSSDSAKPGGTQASGEVTTLTYYYPSFRINDAQVKKVWGHLNEYLKEKENIEIEVHVYDYSEFAGRMETFTGSGQVFDVMFSYGQYLKCVRNGIALPIEDYLKEFPVWKELPESLWQASTVDGHIYGIPTYKDSSTMYGLIYNKNLIDDLGIKVPEKFDGTPKEVIDAFSKLLYDTKAKRAEKYPEDADIPVTSCRIVDSMIDFADNSATEFAASNIPGMERYAGFKAGETLFNIYDTQEYLEECLQMRKWVEDGIFPEDVKNWDPDAVIRRAGKVPYNLGWGYVSVDPHMYGDVYEVAYSPNELRYMTTQTASGYANIVGAKTEHPREAVAFLNALNTDNYAATTVRFGIENEYWKKNANGLLEFKGTLNEDPQNRAWYNWYGIEFGNIFASTLPEGTSTTFKEDMIKANETSYKSDNLGWNFDLTPVANELASCNAIKGEYYDNLGIGMIKDVEATVKEFRQKLKDAGVDKITQEAQKQLNEWRKANGKSVAN